MTTAEGIAELEETFAGDWLEFVKLGDSRFQFDSQEPARGSGTRCLAIFSFEGSAHLIAAHHTGLSCAPLPGISENLEKRAQRPRVTALIRPPASPPASMSVSSDGTALALTLDSADSPVLILSPLSPAVPVQEPARASALGTGITAFEFRPASTSPGSRAAAFVRQGTAFVTADASAPAPPPDRVSGEALVGVTSLSWNPRGTAIAWTTLAGKVVITNPEGVVSRSVTLPPGTAAGDAFWAQEDLLLCSARLTADDEAFADVVFIDPRNGAIFGKVVPPFQMRETSKRVVHCAASRDLVVFTTSDSQELCIVGRLAPQGKWSVLKTKDDRNPTVPMDLTDQPLPVRGIAFENLTDGAEVLLFLTSDGGLSVFRCNRPSPGSKGAPASAAATLTSTSASAQVPPVPEAKKPPAQTVAPLFPAKAPTPKADVSKPAVPPAAAQFQFAPPANGKSLFGASTAVPVLFAAQAQPPKDGAAIPPAATVALKPQVPQPGKQSAVTPQAPATKPALPPSGVPALPSGSFFGTHGASGISPVQVPAPAPTAAAVAPTPAPQQGKTPGRTLLPDAFQEQLDSFNSMMRELRSLHGEVQRVGIEGTARALTCLTRDIEAMLQCVRQIQEEQAGIEQKYSSEKTRAQSAIEQGHMVKSLAQELRTPAIKQELEGGALPPDLAARRTSICSRLDSIRTVMSDVDKRLRAIETSRVRREIPLWQREPGAVRLKRTIAYEQKLAARQDETLSALEHSVDELYRRSAPSLDGDASPLPAPGMSPTSPAAQPPTSPTSPSKMATPQRTPKSTQAAADRRRRLIQVEQAFIAQHQGARRIQVTFSSPSKSPPAKPVPAGEPAQSRGVIQIPKLSVASLLSPALAPAPAPAPALVPAPLLAPALAPRQVPEASPAPAVPAPQPAPLFASLGAPKPLNPASQPKIPPPATPLFSSTIPAGLAFPFAAPATTTTKEKQAPFQFAVPAAPFKEKEKTVPQPEIPAATVAPFSGPIKVPTPVASVQPTALQPAKQESLPTKAPPTEERSVPTRPPVPRGGTDDENESTTDGESGSEEEEAAETTDQKGIEHRPPKQEDSGAETEEDEEEEEEEEPPGPAPPVSETTPKPPQQQQPSAPPPAPIPKPQASLPVELSPVAAARQPADDFVSPRPLFGNPPPSALGATSPQEQAPPVPASAPAPVPVPAPPPATAPAPAAAPSKPLVPGTPLFGAPVTPSSASPAAVPVHSPFSKPSSDMDVQGAAPAPAATGPLFGQTSPFGGPAPLGPAPGASLFGQAATPASATAAGTPSPFGQLPAVGAAAAPLAGRSALMGAFSSAAAPGQHPAQSPFSVPAANPGGALFGQTSALGAAPTQPFGGAFNVPAAPAGRAGPVFGAATAFGAAQFGAPGAATPAASPFGAVAAAGATASPFGAVAAAAPASSPFGTNVAAAPGPGISPAFGRGVTTAFGTPGQGSAWAYRK